MPFADICITSDLTLSTDAAPSDAFTMAEVEVSPYPSSRQRVKNADAAGKFCPMWARTATQGSADAVTMHYRKSSGGHIGPQFYFMGPIIMTADTGFLHGP